MQTTPLYHFCTYFDSNYLIKGLALYRSLAQHCSRFNLWVLCMDRAAYNILSLMNLPELRLISLDEFENNDEALLAAKKNRSLIEYYFTCTPSLPLYILDNWPEVDRITYLDADLFFFAPPEQIYDELGHNSILIVEHRFSSRLRHLERFGIYNVGSLCLRRDESALRCLQWWRERCLEWCYDRVEDGRFADQKYLDDWPDRFSGVVVSRHNGVGIAPWNIANYTISERAGDVMVDEQSLVFFHFHGFNKLNRWIYDPGTTTYQTKLSRAARNHIYKPYIRILQEVAQQVSPFLNGTNILAHSIRSQEIPPTSLMAPFLRQARKARRLFRFVKRLSRGDLLLVVSNRVPGGEN